MTFSFIILHLANKFSFLPEVWYCFTRVGHIVSLSYLTHFLKNFCQKKGEYIPQPGKNMLFEEENGSLYFIQNTPKS